MPYRKRIVAAVICGSLLVLTGCETEQPVEPPPAPVVVAPPPAPTPVPVAPVAPPPVPQPDPEPTPPPAPKRKLVIDQFTSKMTRVQRTPVLVFGLHYHHENWGQSKEVPILWEIRDGKGTIAGTGGNLVESGWLEYAVPNGRPEGGPYSCRLRMNSDVIIDLTDWIPLN